VYVGRASFSKGDGLEQAKHDDESRAALAKGVEIERAKAPRSDATDLGGDWGDWIIAHALMKEAKALIDGESTPGQRAP